MIRSFIAFDVGVQFLYAMSIRKYHYFLPLDGFWFVVLMSYRYLLISSRNAMAEFRAISAKSLASLA